jgi:hypothetical protein
MKQLDGFSLNLILDNFTENGGHLQFRLDRAILMVSSYEDFSFISVGI